MNVKHSPLYKSSAVTAILLIGFIALQGCSSSRKGGRGNLSEAMEKASNDYKGKRKIEKRPTPRQHDTTHYWRADSGHVRSIYRPRRSYEAEMRLHADYGKPWFGISAEYGLLKSDDFYGLTSVAFSYEGFGLYKTRLDLHLSVESSPIQETSPLNKSLDGGILMFQLGADINFFTTPPYTFMGQYFKTGFDMVVMSWAYRNPIITLNEYGGETKIDSDAIWGFGLNVGLGWHIAQTKYFILGGELQPGAIFWGPYTSEDFKNDVFPTFWYLRLSATIKLRLW